MYSYLTWGKPVREALTPCVKNLAAFPALRPRPLFFLRRSHREKTVLRRERVGVSAGTLQPARLMKVGIALAVSSFPCARRLALRPGGK